MMNKKAVVKTEYLTSHGGKTESGFTKKLKTRKLPEAEKKELLKKIADFKGENWVDIDNQKKQLINVGSDIFEIALPITQAGRFSITSVARKNIEKNNEQLISLFSTQNTEICPLKLAFDLSEVFVSCKDNKGDFVPTYTKLGLSIGSYDRFKGIVAGERDSTMLAYKEAPVQTQNSLLAINCIKEMMTEVNKAVGTFDLSDSELDKLKNDDDSFDIYKKIIRLKITKELLMTYNLEEFVSLHEKYIQYAMKGEDPINPEEINKLNLHIMFIYANDVLSDVAKRAKQMVDLFSELRLNSRGGVADIFRLKSRAGWEESSGVLIEDNRQINISTKTIENAQKLLKKL